MLNKVYSSNLVVDGILGPKTLNAFGNKNYFDLKEKYLKNFDHSFNDKFTVLIGAGHGGYCNENKKYISAPSKMYKHSNITAHENGYFYEGHENRIIANMLKSQLTTYGFNNVFLHDPVNDTEPSKRGKTAAEYIKNGFYGVAIDLHSNAIDTNNTYQKLEQTQGGIIFTLNNYGYSNEAAKKYIQLLKNKFGSWAWDNPKYANFSFLKNADLGTPDIIAVLEEYGFFTSSVDTEHIINTRQQRVDNLLQFISECKNKLMKYENGYNTRS